MLKRRLSSFERLFTRHLMKVFEKSAGSAATVQRGTRRLNSSKPRYLFGKAFEPSCSRFDMRGRKQHRNRNVVGT